MLAYREWLLAWWLGDRPRPVLQSVAFDALWRGTGKAADVAPGPDDEHGLHAYLPGSPGWHADVYPGGRVVVAGAIDAHGAVLIHDDGVIRAERARILALRVLPGPAPCGQAALMEFGHRRLAWPLYCDCNLWPNEHSVSYRLRLSLDELEALLLQEYGVPRLPDGAGPWHAGAGA